MNEIDAVAVLIDLDHFISGEYDAVNVFKTDSWHFFKDGKYVAGRPEDATEGAKHHPYVVQWTISSNEEHSQSFLTAQEAAEFYIQKCKELK